MFYEVIEITETAWGEDEIIRGRFTTEAEAMAFRWYKCSFSYNNS